MDYTNEIIQKVWEKATPVEGYDENILRQDPYGKWIVRNHCGDKDSDLSWEIDNYNSSFLNDGESLENLRPVQWKSKRVSRFADKVVELYVKNLMFR